MHHLYTIAEAVMKLVFAAFVALFFLIMFDSVNAKEAEYAMWTMLISSTICVILFEIRLQRSKRARG
jgi:hypothetical protein